MMTRPLCSQNGRHNIQRQLQRELRDIFVGQDKAPELRKTAEAKQHCLCSAKGERGFLRFRNTG
jgi:hypothetical protein